MEVINDKGEENDTRMESRWNDYHKKDHGAIRIVSCEDLNVILNEYYSKRKYYIKYERWVG